MVGIGLVVPICGARWFHLAVGRFWRICVISWWGVCRFVWAGRGGAGAVCPSGGDAGGLCPGGWCRSLCGRGGSAIDCGFGFVARGVVPKSLNQLSQTAEPKDYIYSVACEV